MGLLIKLRTLHRAKKKRGCVAYGWGSDKKRYYAINGNPHDERKMRTIVEGIIGNNPDSCDYNDSFTVLKPGLDKKAIDFAKQFCEMLDYGPQAISFELDGHEIYSNGTNANISYDNRYFTCAEKKIIGRMRKTPGLECDYLLTTMAPCYHCLPVIKRVYYLYNDMMVKTIEQLQFFITWGNTSIKKYTRFDYKASKQ